MLASVSTSVKKEQKGRCLILTLDGPQTRNAVSAPVYSELQQHLIDANDDPAISVIILYGANNFFCSGGDVNNLKKSADLPFHEVTLSTDKLHSAVKWIRNCSKPIIAAVEGGAAGAGFSLALACDMIVATDVAKFTVAYVKIGLTPDGGVTHFLTNALPRQLLSEICFFGKSVDSMLLHRHGLVNEIVVSGEALAKAIEVAQNIASGPQMAISKIKELIAVAPKNDLATQLDAEALGINRARYGDEAKEGIRAFLEKRKPNFS